MSSRRAGITAKVRSWREVGLISYYGLEMRVPSEEPGEEAVKIDYELVVHPRRQRHKCVGAVLSRVTLSSTRTGDLMDAAKEAVAKRFGLQATGQSVMALPGSLYSFHHSHWRASFGMNLLWNNGVRSQAVQYTLFMWRYRDDGHADSDDCLGTIRYPHKLRVPQSVRQEMMRVAKEAVLTRVVLLGVRL